MHDAATLVAIVALLGVAALLVAHAGRTQSARRFRPSFRRFPRRDRRPEIANIGYQLEAVIAAKFERRRVMNSGEYRAFRIIEQELASERRGHRVFAQTNLGEILWSRSTDAFRSINSKRVDILIVDPGGWPVLAVEVQGEGHFQGNAIGRDAVKKEALLKAGVRYLEIRPADSDDQIRAHLREHLGWRPVAVSA